MIFNSIECPKLMNINYAGWSEVTSSELPASGEDEKVSPYMLQVLWKKSSGWETPEIISVTDLHIHPAAKVIQRGLSVRK